MTFPLRERIVMSDTFNVPSLPKQHRSRDGEGVIELGTVLFDTLIDVGRRFFVPKISCIFAGKRYKERFVPSRNPNGG